MASTANIKSRLAAVDDVDIDTGRFKYVLMKLYSANPDDDSGINKTIVRGYARGGFHADIYEEVYERIQGLGLDSECLGGGRIEHYPDKKTIKVYGYSQAYGQPDHSITCDILKKRFHGYNISWSNEGY